MKKGRNYFCNFGTGNNNDDSIIITKTKLRNMPGFDGINQDDVLQEMTTFLRYNFYRSSIFYIIHLVTSDRADTRDQVYNNQLKQVNH